MNENMDLDTADVLTDSDLLLADETELNETVVDTETDTEQTDTEAVEDVSATESLSVADTPTAECQFTDINICSKLDIIIMLLIVMIAVRMFSPLANNHKRGINRKGENR